MEEKSERLQFQDRRCIVVVFHVVRGFGGMEVHGVAGARSAFIFARVAFLQAAREQLQRRNVH